MAKITFQDEEGQNLNRFTITPVDGEANTYDISRAADITKQGTPINKATMDHMVQFEDVSGGELDETITGRINVQKDRPNGIPSLDESGKINPDQLPLNFSGNLTVHVVSEDSGSISGTRVRIRNEQLGSNYVQPLDTLGNTTFSLLDNHTYYVVLLDYPSQYYGAAATVTITGGETQELTLTLKTTPDIVGYKINVATGEVTYTDGAADFEPMSMNSGSLSPGSWEGHWALDVKPCLLKGLIPQYYLKKTSFLTYDYEHQANGTSSDIRSGDDGDVMNELPLMYYKWFNQTEPDGTAYRCFKLAKQPQDDTWCCNAFLNRSGAAQSVIYLPAYKGTIYNGKLRSLCGVVPTVSQTIGAFRTAANANGTGYEIRELAKDRLLAALMTLFFRGLNGQALLGLGRTSAGNAVESGTLNGKPLIWGDQTGTNGVKFMGIEHFWGNVYDFMDGISQNDADFLYKIYGPYNDSGSGYLTGPALPESGWIDDMNYANGYGMVPSAVASDESSSKYHDYFYKGSNGYIRYVGGDWSDGARAGPFYWNESTASGTSTYFGASLFATPQ